MNKLAIIRNPLLNPSVGKLSGVEFIQGLIRTGITAVLALGGTFFLFYLFYGAIIWMTSGSDKGKLEEARATLIHALVGLLILFSTWAIVKLVESLFGISILLIDISSLTIR